MYEKTLTEREAVLRERKAFEEGVAMFYIQREVPALLGSVADRVQARAAEIFPLPKVTRPRVVKDRHGRQWRVIGGELSYCEKGMAFADGHGWHSINKEHWTIDAELVTLWADLLANPLEECDAD